MREACSDAGATFVGLGDPSRVAADLAHWGRKFDHAGVDGRPGDRGLRVVADALWEALRKRAASD